MSAGSLSVEVVARVGDLRLDVKLNTAPGTLVVVGPNGAGKSSLLSLVLGVLPLEAGRVAVGDALLSDTALGVDLPLERRRLGYVPQDCALFPHLTARGNVEFALASAPSRLVPKARAARARALLDELGLGAQAERATHGLSGGEKQRVALARALAVGPRALLLDEPLAALDVDARHEVRAFLATLLARLDLPALVITHDAADARTLGHRIAVLEAGRLTQTGTWAELAARPASRFVERFVASAT